MNKVYRIEYEDSFKKEFQKLDYSVARSVKRYIKNKLENTDDPRAYGKPLVGDLKNCWRYRIGDFRMIVKIDDDVLVILAIHIDHRSRVYKR